MKLVAGVILSLSFLELFHCAPLVGSDDGSYKETHTSSSWGYNAGFDANLGLEAGWKDGHGVLGTKNHFGVNVGGHKENGQKDIYHQITPVPAPNNFGSGFSPYQGPGSPYYMYAPQPLPQYPPQGGQQFVTQPNPYAQQYAQQYGYALQGAPQYVPQYALQGAPQYIPQGAPQYPPQGAPQYAPQGSPQYPPQGAPQYAPQGSPQYPPQGAPQYATQGAPQHTVGPLVGHTPEGLQYAPVPQYVQQAAPQNAKQATPRYAPTNGATNEDNEENFQ